ncbi:hypothetical protein DNHGIG_21470 [Collibacillus ludicampi]|uniref:Acriflavine resistance protein B n=1 Tax=Collibacillus ludicampi TaxID=2771369 RepID=A0AAV4LFQ6_9BACL|nr:hypothetical protein DNHGIG_21470 [Collibacillus ludicampi]
MKMKRFLEAIMKRTILVIACILLIFVWGGFSAYQMQRDYLPSIDNSTLMITVHAPDEDAAQVKENVAPVLEQAVRGVDGLSHVETNSLAGGLFMSLSFPLDYDMKKAEAEVAHALEGVSLPNGVDKPLITRVSSSSLPMMRISLTSPSDRVDEQMLRTSVQEHVVRELKRIPGVSDIRVTGGGTNGYRVTLRIRDLEREGLTIQDVQQSLSAFHLTLPQGRVTGPQTSISLQVAGWDFTEQDIKNALVHNKDGKTVPLSHVADVTQTIIDLQTVSRTNGKPSVMMDVLKTPSSNITEVSERVMERLQHIPDVRSGNIQLSVLYDKGEEIKSSLMGLVKEGVLGSVFAMFCVFLFFRHVRTTLLIVLSLPICLSSTTAILKTMGITLNILTISGLIVAMGRVVDDSIVILDNMYRKVSESEGKWSPGIIADAVREMIPAVVSSTATTVVVFLPIALSGGMISAAFSGFAWSVTIALITSLFVSLMVVPALYNLGWKKAIKDSAASVEAPAERVLRWAFRRRGKVIAVCVTIFLVTGVMAASLPVNFLPTNRSGQILMQLELPEEVSWQEVDQEVRHAESYLKAKPEVETFSATFGSSFTPQFDDVFDEGGGWVQEDHVANIAVTVKPGVDIDRLISDMRSTFVPLSNSTVDTITNQNIAGDDSQLKIDLTGADSQTLENAARMIRSKLQLVPGISVEGTADDKGSATGYQIRLNREAIEKNGVPMEDVLHRIERYVSQSTNLMITMDQRMIPVAITTDFLGTQQTGNGGNIGNAPAKDILSS